MMMPHDHVDSPNYQSPLSSSQLSPSGADSKKILLHGFKLYAITTSTTGQGVSEAAIINLSQSFPSISILNLHACSWRRVTILVHFLTCLSSFLFFRSIHRSVKQLIHHQLVNSSINRLVNQSINPSVSRLRNSWLLSFI